MYNIGKVKKGGVDMGKTKQMRKLAKAAKMGRPSAMYRFGIRCEKQDMIKAASWISAAAEAGYAPAIEWMKDYRFDDNAEVQAHS